MKKLICLVLSWLLLFSLTSCAIIDRFKGDMSKLSYDDNHNLLYGDSRYYRSEPPRYVLYFHLLCPVA